MGVVKTRALPNGMGSLAPQATAQGNPSRGQADASAQIFNGLTARQAKRRALSFWYAHQRELGLTVVEFFARCRLTQEAGLSRITFLHDRSKVA